MKAPSGRKFACVAVVSSFCVIMGGLTFAVITKRLEVDVYAGLFAAFGITVGKVIDFYFFKNRNGENGNGKI